VKALETPGITLEQFLHWHRRETRRVGAQIRHTGVRGPGRVVAGMRRSD